MAEETLEQKQLVSDPEVTENKETEEPKPITAEDLLKIKEEAVKEAFEQYKGIQRVISKVQDENKKLKEQLGQTTDFSNLLELAEQQALSYGDTESLTRIAALKVADAEKQRKLAFEQQLAKQQEITENKRTEIESKIKASGQDPEDPKFDNVWLAWELAASVDGDFSKADKRLEKLIGTAKTEPKTNPPAESEAQLREKLEREILEKHGLLEKEKLGSGASSKRIFTTSQISNRDFWEKNKEEILKAQSEGRIKEG